MNQRVSRRHEPQLCEFLGGRTDAEGGGDLEQRTLATVHAVLRIVSALSREFRTPVNLPQCWCRASGVDHWPMVMQEPQLLLVAMMVFHPRTQPSGSP